MSVLTRYIVVAILKDALIAALLLLTLFNLFTFGDELDDIGKGDYGLPEVFYYLALTSPAVFYELMPAAALVGGLFALGGLANRHELVAMRAAGWPVWAIIKAAMVAGLVLAALAVAAGEWLAPITEPKAQLVRISSEKGHVVLRTRYGLWLREGGQFINIRSLADNGDLQDVSIYQLDDRRRLARSTHAGRAVHQDGGGWLLHDVRQTDIAIGQMRTQAMPEQVWPSSIDPGLMKIAVVKPHNLSLYDLAMYVDFLQENRQEARVYQMALWGRVSNPMVIFVMLLVSVPFVIGVRRGIGVGARILIGAVVGLGFNIFDMTVSQLAVIYGLYAPVAAFLPSAVVAAAALVAIRRAHG